jgi:hypothetical protein
VSGYNYTDYILAISAALESPLTNPTANPQPDAPFVDQSYNNWLPRAIEAAEQRIYRELDLLACYFVDSTQAVTPNTRQFTLPTDAGTFIVVSEVCVFSPAGTRVQLLPVSKEYLDACWPTDAPAFIPSVPQVWCPFNQSTIILGPAPDTAYGTEITGMARPAPLSSTNVTTPIVSYVPDLMIFASLLSFISFQRDLGAASSDGGQQAITWESQYQTAKQSAQVEQFRVRFQTQGWGSRIPAPVATPPQT